MRTPPARREFPAAPRARQSAAASRNRRTAAPGDWVLRASSLSGASEGDPGEGEDGVVVMRVAAGTVEIHLPAIEALVIDVLQAELHIEPRPEGRAAVIERDVIELADPAAAVRAAGSGPGVQRGIVAAGNVEVAERQPVGLVVVIGRLGVPAAQVVARVRGAAGRLARREIVILGNPARLHREAVAGTQELVLRIDSHVDDVVGAEFAHAAGDAVYRQAEGAELEAALAPFRLDGEPPIRSDILDRVGAGRFYVHRCQAPHREAAIEAGLGIDEAAPISIGGGADDLLI